jgi:hypothetical protein
VALAAALTGVAMLATALLVMVGDLALGGWTSVLGTVLLPLATGAAILRYRLYDTWTGSSAGRSPTGC